MNQTKVIIEKEKRQKRNLLLFKILPKNIFSRIIGFFERLPLPLFILNKLIKVYIKAFNVKDEYIIPEKGFRSFDDFFTRELIPGARKIDKDKNVIVSPVDARIDQFGEIDGSQLIQAKGMHYRLEELIPSDYAVHFVNGSFITMYLSPSDYHRIHSPVDGSINGYFLIPGTLFTVQEYMVRSLPNLFIHNERVITYLESEHGLVALCKVGAFNVGRISLSYDDIISNKTFQWKKEKIYSQENKIMVHKGDELGMFHLGSTVILLFQKDKITFSNVNTGKKVYLGEKIAVVNK